MAGPDLVVMGRASGAFGLRGELKVFSFAKDPGILQRAGVLYAGPGPQDVRALTLLSLRPHGKRLLMRVSELTTREQAAELAGHWIYLPREALAPLEQGEYYWADLKGAAVSTTDGHLLGRVKSLLDSGAHDLLVVEGPQGRELLVPMIEGVISQMDIPAGRVVVDLPEGLLEAQDWPSPADG